ncbi:transposase [Nocardiopsis mwathae]|uniref:Transposase n=1 Tax=Nocardiopsis mwathae TaxID=1472723 RepID=A0A7X0D8P3_9ACTN|nr:winged helix-turn-helix domain-containing protein [Nocardiopsis mwathae]MBB6174229.1 transposase [Nocardiopsis mwathae]
MEVPPAPRTPDELQDRRMKAAALFEAGHHTQAEIARLLGTTRQAVNKWHKQWKAGGTQALASRPAGAAPLLEADREHRLLRLLDQGPAAHGWNDQIWTLSRINRLISEHFNVAFADPSGVWRMLQRLGYSWQVPAARAVQRDEEEIAAWCTATWPQAKRPR